MEVTQTVKQVLDSRTRVNVYPVPGPYGIDAVRATPRGTVGHTQSVRFDSPIPRWRELHQCRMALAQGKH